MKGFLGTDKRNNYTGCLSAVWHWRGTEERERGGEREREREREREGGRRRRERRCMRVCVLERKRRGVRGSVCLKERDRGEIERKSQRKEEW